MVKFLKNNLVLMLFLVSTVVVIFMAIYASRLMQQSSKQVEGNVRLRMEDLSRGAALLVDGDWLENCTEEKAYAADYAALVKECKALGVKVSAETATDEESALFETKYAELLEYQKKPLAELYSAEYLDIKTEIEKFAKDSNVLYVYYVRLSKQADGHMEYIIDNITSYDEEGELSGLDSLLVDEVDDEYYTAESTGQPVSAELANYSGKWEGYMFAYAPVYNSDGDVVAVAGVDILDSQILKTRQDTNMLAVFLILCIIIVTGSCFFALGLYMKKASQSESANLAKSSFLSRMSHEMRTPMNAIMGLCKMAQDTDDIEDIKSYLENINTSSKHLRQVIDDVLDLSKIESGKIELEVAPVNIRNEIDKIDRMILPQAKAKNQFFEINIDDDIPDNLYCDSAYVRQIIVNLLSNAIKFTPIGGKIDLDVRLMSSKDDLCNIQCSVKDNGIGIDENYLGNIFQPFEQGDGSTTRKFGGTGLGLAITRQLVELMGGEISVYSVIEVGSEFTFNLMLKKAPDDWDDGENDEKEDLEIDLSGKHVLLVEDVELNQMIAENLFKSFGAEVDTADNGEKGVEMYLANPEKYTAIFMDIQMPVMDGYEATRAIRSSNTKNAKTVPIIAMTANVFKEDVKKAADSGMNGHIGKPFEADAIKQVLAKILN